MKRIIFSRLATLVLGVLILSSCNSLSKMKKNAGTVKYEVNPEFLEAHAGKVQGTVKATYPASYFNKKAVVEITPVVKYDGGELALSSVTYQGEGVKENFEVVTYETGGSKTYSFNFPYEDKMLRSEMEVRVKAWKKTKAGDATDLGTFKIADGIVSTSELLVLDPKPAFVGDNFKRIVGETKESEILFNINSADLRNTELKKGEVKDFQTYVKAADQNPRVELKGITVSAYASPDGALDLNTRLSEKRGTATDKYLKGEAKKQKLSKASNSDFLSIVQTPEDWDGFKKLMEASSIQDKELVLRVLSMYSDPEVREREIKNISKAYTEIADQILPQLRRSKLIANVDLIGYSDEELVQLASNNVDSLKLEELLYAASLVQDDNKKAELYGKAGDKFSDWRGYNGQGVVYLKQNKLDAAKASFDKAKAIKDEAAVKNNLGVVALLNNDVKGAKELFSSAMGAGEVVNYNLGLISVIEGNYKDAVNYFGGACEYNAGLAKLLNKQTDAALATLDCVKNDDAKVYYLKAIAGARSAKNDLVFNNLRSAVSKDANLKAYAKKDVEFFKYFEDSTFKSIVE